MIKNKRSQRIIAFIMALISLLTMLPTSVILALANTASGQIEIDNGSKYAVQWEYLKYPGYKTIYQYNRSLATDDSGYTYSQGWYDILKKYVSTSSGGQKSPAKSAVPIYRVSRSNGDTNADTAATAVNTVNIENEMNLYSSATKDDIKLTRSQATMIVKVLLNGFKQFTGQKQSGDTHYSTQFYKDELYFLATQVIIWEIQEGKRVGWGNSTSYKGTQTSAYPKNSRNASRDSTIKSAYGNPSASEREYVYYWHDYYYTVKNNQFASYPDYYNEILEACAALSSSFKYGTGNTPNLKFSDNQNTTYNMTYNSSTKRYEKSFVVTKSFLGETYGKYDVDDIVLPIANTKVYQQNKTVNVYSLPSTTSKKNNTYTSGANFNVKGITRDGQFYYVGYISGGKDTYGYVKVGDVIRPSSGKLTSPVSVTVSGNKLTFRTSSISSETLKIIWSKNVPNSYNEATYFTGAGKAVRGYVSGGNQSTETSYFNLKTPTYTVTYKCGVCEKTIGTKKVPAGYVLTSSDVPNHNENSDYYTFKNWTKGSTSISTPAGQKITSNTTFVKNYTLNTKTIKFWCTIPEDGSSENVLIKSVTVRNGSYVTIPQTHSHENYQFKYWSTSPTGGNANINSGSEYLSSDLSTNYYAVYENLYTVEYVCGECGEVLGSFTGTSGTKYTIPNYQHIHDGNFVKEETGQEASYDTLDYSFARWSDDSTSGNTGVITENKTIYAYYSYYNKITVESHLYNEDTATEDELDDWNSTKDKAKYSTNSISTSTSYSSGNIQTTVFRTNIEAFNTLNAKAPTGWHIASYEVVDSNGEVSYTANGVHALSIKSTIDEIQGSYIKVYYEPDDCEKSVTINYVLSGENSNFNDDDNEIIMSRSFEVKYDEVLDLLNRQITSDTSEPAVNAFEAYLDYNEMQYVYNGKYGYILDDNVYHHYNDDKTGTGATIPALKNFRVTSNMDIYLYYSPPTMGGITFNLYSSFNQAYNLAENNTTLKLYSSDIKINQSQLYVVDDETGESKLNTDLVFEADYTDKMASMYKNNDGSNNEYPVDSYKYKASISFSPDELTVGKYYYFIYDDNEFDEYYYTPTFVGGTAWTGYYLEYNTTCDIGPVLNVLQVTTHDLQGNSYPAQNAKIIWETTDEAQKRSGALAVSLMVFAGLVAAGEATQDDLEDFLMTSLTEVNWSCISCGNTNTTSITSSGEFDLVCRNCGFNNEGLNFNIGLEITDENGMVSFYSQGTGYSFAIMSDDFITNGNTDNSENYSERTTNIYSIKNDGSKNKLISTSDTYDDSGNKIRVTNETGWEPLSVSYSLPANCVNYSDPSFASVDLYQVKHPITISVESAKNTTNIDDLISRDENSTLEFKVYDKDLNVIYQKDIKMKDYLLTDDKGRGYISIEYTPENIKERYYFSIKIKDVNDYSVDPYSQSVDYKGFAETLTFTVNKSDSVSNKLAIPLRFDSDISPDINDEEFSNYKPGMYTQWVLNNYDMKNIDVYYEYSEYDYDQALISKGDLVLKDSISYKDIINGFNKEKENMQLIKDIEHSSWAAFCPNVYMCQYTLQSNNGSKYHIYFFEVPQSESKSFAATETDTAVRNFVQKKASDNFSTNFITDLKSGIVLTNSLNCPQVTGASTKITDRVSIVISQEDVLDGLYMVNPTYDSDDTIYVSESDQSKSGIYSISASRPFSGEPQLTVNKDNRSVSFDYYKKVKLSNDSTKAFVKNGDTFDVNDWEKYFSNEIVNDLGWQGSVYLWTKSSQAADEEGGTYYDVLPVTYAVQTNTNEFSDVRNAGSYDDLIKTPFSDGWNILPIKMAQTKTGELPDGSLEVEFVQPNADYNYGTEVMSTFKVTNNSTTDYTDLAPLKATFTSQIEYTVNDINKTFDLYSDSKNMVVPANKQNIVYFKWYVPTEENIKKKIAEESGVDADAIAIRSAKVNLKVTGNYEGNGTVGVSTFNTSAVKKEGYKLFGSSGFTYSEPTSDKNYANVANWQEYTCENGNFQLINNTARLGYISNLLRPHEDSPTKEVRDDQWVTKSGYALSTLVKTSATVNSENEYIKNNSVIPAQTALVYYPEYNYSTGENKYESLNYNTTNSGFVFNDVANASTVKSRHYIPVWYPDIEYKTQTLVSNMWTPAGMLSYLGNSNPVIVDGSLFDNYHTQQTS